ncbi:MAG: 30S ribosomal protein S8 [Bacteroidetes bacterium]|nr:30S ribosomal protein S8 [Bacteroidota bacterium]
MIIDPIGDLLTRLRNAYMARILELKVPSSSIKLSILKVLKKNKYISDFSITEEEGNKKTIVVTLNNVRITKYVPTFKRISKP